MALSSTRLVVHFTIWTNHRNLLFVNNHGSKNVLQWKIDIQHDDMCHERLTFVRPTPYLGLTVHHNATSLNRTILYLPVCTLRGKTHVVIDDTTCPGRNDQYALPYIRSDVRQFVQFCASCQKWTPDTKRYGQPLPLGILLWTSNHNLWTNYWRTITRSRV